MKHLERITINPAVCHGKPSIRGMRWPVVVLLDMVGSGMSFKEILDDHPELQENDILAAVNYAALYLNKVELNTVA